MPSVYWAHILTGIADLHARLVGATGFEWDAGNATKNRTKHTVGQAECEQLFFHAPRVLAGDPAHSAREVRSFALGQTDAARLLLVVFTLRGSLIRVISARPMSRREREVYAEAEARSEDRAPTAARPALLPAFACEAEERAFWGEHDTADHVDWSAAERVRLPNLKPSTATISLRLPEGMLEELKVLANQRDVPYQSLLKVFLAERLAAERLRGRRAS